MLKLTISEFFKRLTIQIWRPSYERTLQGIRWFLLASFIAVVIADLAECSPVTHYWQVLPDPGGECRQGYTQLVTMGTANVITDLLLVLFPVPIILRSKMGLKKKVQLVLLFGGSLLPAGTTLFRIPNIIDRHGVQQYRSLLASIEILFATAVANGLVLGSFARDRGLKKHRWRFGSLSDSMEQGSRRRGTVTRHWGSDEDLVRDLGLGVDPELRDDPPSTRLAPMAAPGFHSTKGKEPWSFPTAMRTSEASDDLNSAPRIPDGISPFEVPSIITPSRKVSFFDVGGLLEDEPNSGPGPEFEPPRRLSSIRTTDTTDVEPGSPTTFVDHPHPNPHPHPNGLSPAPPRRGSSALLQDIGGLLGSPTRPPRTAATAECQRSFELQDFMRERPPDDDDHHTAPPLRRLSRQISLQDVGGLLKRD